MQSMVQSPRFTRKRLLNLHQLVIIWTLIHLVLGNMNFSFRHRSCLCHRSNNENEFKRFQLWIQLCSFALLMDFVINFCWFILLAHNWRSLWSILTDSKFTNASLVIKAFHLTVSQLISSHCSTLKWTLSSWRMSLDQLLTFHTHY